MTDKELSRYCERHSDCDGLCTKCAAYKQYEDKKHDSYEEYCLQQEIMETACDNIGF